MLCRSSKYILIQKFLLHKNTCFFFLSLESKVISLLPYGTAGRGRVKWRDSGCKEQLCTTSVHLWLCQSMAWVLGGFQEELLPCQDTLQPQAVPQPGSPSSLHWCSSQSSSKAEIIQDTYQKDRLTMLISSLSGDRLEPLSLMPQLNLFSPHKARDINHVLFSHFSFQGAWMDCNAHG